MKNSPMPLWDALLGSIRRFNILTSLPRTFWSYLMIQLGLVRLKDPRPVLMTFSISEDHARLWHYFATRAVGDRWQLVIGDSCGRINPKNFPGARVIRVPNHLYHGAKIDFTLRHVFGHQAVMLSDDDMYLLFDPTDRLVELDEPKVAALALCPRTWYTLSINGQASKSTGAHGLIFRPELFMKNGWRFQSPKGIDSPYREFAAGVKHQKSYDTGDFASEQIVLAGYRITAETHPGMIGFSGLSGVRILLGDRDRAYVEAAIMGAQHFKEGSVNAYFIKGLVAIVLFEKLYRKVFGQDPEFVSGFSGEALVAMLERNPHLSAEDKAMLVAYFHETEQTVARLEAYASSHA